MAYGTFGGALMNPVQQFGGAKMEGFGGSTPTNDLNNINTAVGAYTGDPAGYLVNKQAISHNGDLNAAMNDQWGAHNTNTANADKMGLGSYHPNQPQLDETAYTDTTRSDARQNALGAQLAAIQGRQAPTMNAANVGPASQMNAAQLSDQQNQFRQGQVSLAGALQQQAAGQGPSVAQAQLNQARDQQIQTAMGLASSQRGLTAGQGLRSIADQTASANRFAGAEAARQRIVEQMSAQQQLGGLYDSARGADINFASQNAGLQQQSGLANQSANNQMSLQQALFNQQANTNNQAAMLQQSGMNDNFANALNQQMNGLSSDDQKRLMDLQAMKYGGQITQKGYEQQSFDQRNKNMAGFMGGLGQGIMALGSGAAAA